MTRSHRVPGDPNFNRSAHELRARGYVPLPRLWVPREAMHEIHAITDRYREEVQAIRQEINGGPLPPKQEEKPKDPATDRDAAWDAFEKQRKSS